MLPTHLLIDATLQTLTERGVFYYILQRGERGSGVILLKISDRAGQCKLVTQQRDLEGDMQWVAALEVDIVLETDADAYIQRSVGRDPDLWVVEIEDPDMRNPFIA